MCCFLFLYTYIICGNVFLLKMLSYYTAKGTFTKLQQETQEEIAVADDQVKAKKATEIDQTPVPQTGQADGKISALSYVQFENFFFFFYVKVKSYLDFTFIFLIVQLVDGFIRNNLLIVEIQFFFFCFMLAFSRASIFLKFIIHFV